MAQMVGHSSGGVRTHIVVLVAVGTGVGSIHLEVDLGRCCCFDYNESRTAVGGAVAVVGVVGVGGAAGTGCWRGYGGCILDIQVSHSGIGETW